MTKENRTLAEDYIRLSKIAIAPDEAIDMFKDTAIYKALLQRRELARKGEGERIKKTKCDSS